jgi:ribosomal protein L12E/L44/L45/RPP1/RPP2
LIGGCPTLIGAGDPMLDKPDNEDTNGLAASLSGGDVMSQAAIAEEEEEEEEEQEEEEEEDDMLLLGPLLA